MMMKSAVRTCKICAFLFSLCTNLLAPVLLLIQSDFGLSMGASGLLFSIFYAGNFTACLISGRIMGKIGKRLTLCLGMTAMSLLSMLTACAPTIAVLCMLLYGLGFATLISQVAASAIAPEAAGGASVTVTTEVQAYCGLGSCAGLLCSGLLAALGVPWRMPYLLFSGIAGAGALRCWFTKFPILTGAGQASGLLKLLKNINLFPTLICLLIYTGAEASIGSWLVTYLSKERAYSTFAGSLITATVWLSLFAGRVVCAKLAKIYPVRNILCVLIPASALSVGLIPILPDTLIWLGAVALGLTLSGIWPLVASRLIDDPLYDSGTALSAAYLFSFAGNTALPFLIGAIAGSTTLAFALVIDGGVLLLLFAVFYRFRRQTA